MCSKLCTCVAASLPPQFTFLLDDIGIPLNYRHMEGFGVHTFKLLNAAGKETYVKFHWKPKCGECLVCYPVYQTHKSSAIRGFGLCVVSVSC